MREIFGPDAMHAAYRQVLAHFALPEAEDRYLHYREMFRTRGAISGFAFQMINGLSKLRVANAATYALARWARQFSEQKQAALATRRWAAGQHALNALLQPLALVFIYGFVDYGGPPDEARPALDLPAFLSFNTAFGQAHGGGQQPRDLSEGYRVLGGADRHHDRGRPPRVRHLRGAWPSSSGS